MYMFLFALRFTEVYWVIYLRTKGLTFAAIGILEAVFHAASLLTEVPSGMLADHLGRKSCLILGRCLAAASALMILGSRDWKTIAVAFALNAASYTCHSGAFDALFFDSIPCEEKQHFARFSGTMNSIYLAGSSLATLTAAFIARTSLERLYRLAIITDLTAALISLLIHEDTDALRKARKDKGISGDLRRMLRAETHSVISAMKSPSLRSIFLVWGTSSALLTSVCFYGQEFLRESLVPLAFIGISGTVANLLAIAPAKTAYRLTGRFGEISPLISGTALIPTAVLLMAILPAKRSLMWRLILIACYISLTLINEALYPLFSQAANRRVDSATRATVLSVGNMVFSVVMIVLFPLLGYIGDRLGLRWGMVLVACLASAALVPALTGLSRSTQPPQPGSSA